LFNFILEVHKILLGVPKPIVQLLTVDIVHFKFVIVLVLVFILVEANRVPVVIPVDTTVPDDIRRLHTKFDIVPLGEETLFDNQSVPTDTPCTRIEGDVPNTEYKLFTVALLHNTSVFARLLIVVEFGTNRFDIVPTDNARKVPVLTLPVVIL
jgi:hypothetical protein